jgi:hypothetical protein
MSQPFAQTVQSFAVFSMHTSAPYIRSIRASDHSEFRDADSLTWVGYNDYLDELSNAHPAGYKGLFTIGFWWQEHTAAASSSSEPVLIVPKGDD